LHILNFSLNELETPFIIAGKNVKKGGKFSESMMQYDVAATIAEIFALDTPQVWTSKSMSQVFEQSSPNSFVILSEIAYICKAYGRIGLTNTKLK